jgi:ABC-type glycerol-3-phosphate transport system permease component
MKKSRQGLDVIDIIMLIFFLALVVFVIFPLFWMLVTAFKNPQEISSIPPSVFPRNWYFNNFKKILTDKFFLRYFQNSMIVAVTVTVIAVMGSSLMGFVFAKYQFPGKNILFYAILITIMVPFEAYIVQTYSIARFFKATNTYFGLLFPSIISSFGIFFMRQNMEAIPNALIEAARIDGAGHFYIFGKIMLPLSVSSISVLSILLFLTEWSSYLWPLLIATKKEMFVLEIGLTLLQDEYFIDYGIMMAGCVVALIPALILFIFFRHYIMEGIAMTGIKG